MAKEIDSDSVKPEVMKLENGDAENITDNSIDEGKMVPESADIEHSECLEEEATNVDKQQEHFEVQGEDLKDGDKQREHLEEQGEDLKDGDKQREHLEEQGEDLKDGDKQRGLLEEQGEDLKDGDILEDTTGETSLRDEIELPEGRARSSRAFVIGANHKFPVRSRYLSASVGSCHDLCKFGHKHQEPEKETRRPFGKIREGRPLARTSGDNMTRTVLNEGAKKKKDGRRLSLPGYPQGEKESPTSLKKNSFERDLNCLKFKHVQSEMKPSSVPLPRHRNRNESQSGKKIAASLVENTTPKVKEVKTKREKGTVSREKEKAKEKAKAPMNNSISPVKKSSSIQTRLYKNLANNSHSKRPIVSGKASKVELRIESKSVRTVSKVAPPNEPSPSTSQQSQVRKNKDSTKDSQTQSRNSVSSSFSPSQTKGEAQQRPEPINRKVVRKVKSENGSSVDSRMIPRRKGSLPEDKEASAWKVKFKRGTVVALQGSNNSPRKLKFKRGKILDDGENAKDGISCELNCIDDRVNESNGAKPEPRKVQLRHQEASGKKDNVDLNNVIEETATKLAKTRKSKVKALVGAFESVMSVREPVMEAGAS